jgi:hypothetical protein
MYVCILNNVWSAWGIKESYGEIQNKKSSKWENEENNFKQPIMKRDWNYELFNLTEKEFFVMKWRKRRKSKSTFNV